MHEHIWLLSTTPCASKEAGNYYFAVSSSFIWTFIGQTRSSDRSIITKSKYHECFVTENLAWNPCLQASHVWAFIPFCLFIIKMLGCHHHLLVILCTIFGVVFVKSDFAGISCAENLLQSIYGVGSEDLCQRNCIEDSMCNNYTYIYTNDVNCLLFETCNIVVTCEDCVSGKWKKIAKRLQSIIR